MTKLKPKIVFLYTELAAYFMACLKTLMEESDAEVHVIRWPVNQEAPFQFSEDANLNLYSRENYSDTELLSLIQSIQPDVLFCSGWIDKGYLAVAKKMKGKCPTVLCLDNHWNGSAKQQLARMLSPFTLKQRFSHVWVPGSPQYAYAKKLGFADDKIQKGFYCADTTLFDSYYQKNFSNKEKQFPHQFLYIGRYLDFKGIFDLWSAFQKLHTETACDWELICVGAGDLWDQRVEHPKIKHLGFVQPEALGAIIADAGVFVLPSHREPWAVTVHEFAAAGFPLLCSEAVGANDRFLDEGENGFSFPIANSEELYQCMAQITQKTDDELVKMSQKSNAIATSYTTSDWVKTIYKFLE